MKHICLTTVALVAAMLLAGCEGFGGRLGKALETSKYRFLDPSKVVVPQDDAVRPIYSNSGDADDNNELPPNATPPTAADLTYSDRDYIIGPTDVLDISVLDLLENGIETVLRRQVTTSGHIDLPLLPERLKVTGQNKDGLTEVIKAAYAKDILRDPVVAVTLAAKRQSTYSILGAVSGPGTYQIERRDMRLLNALASARGITQENIRYIYVIRPKPAEVMNPDIDSTSAPATVTAPTAASRTAPEATIRPDVPPVAPIKTEDNTKAFEELGKLISGGAEEPDTKPAKDPNGMIPAPAALPTFVETSSITAVASTSAEAGPQADGKSEKWVYVNNKWIKTVQKAAVATRPSGKGAPTVIPVKSVPEARTATVIPRRETGRTQPRTETYEDPYQWKDADKSSLARVIFIDLKRLRQGDPRLNIVIRDNDIIRVPALEVGEFYIMGEVQRPGVYTLTGRRVTIKMALAAAGNLGAMAYPENSILVRRIGRDQEQTTAINVRAICAGEEPDQFLKPNDVLEIGTHWKTSFLAVVRNAFRVSYGMGLIYDRNFGAARVPGYKMDGFRFSRW